MEGVSSFEKGCTTSIQPIVLQIIIRNVHQKMIYICTPRCLMQNQFHLSIGMAKIEACSKSFDCVTVFRIDLLKEQVNQFFFHQNKFLQMFTNFPNFNEGTFSQKICHLLLKRIRSFHIKQPQKYKLPNVTTNNRIIRQVSFNLRFVGFSRTPKRIYT